MVPSPPMPPMIVDKEDMNVCWIFDEYLYPNITDTSFTEHTQINYEFSPGYFSDKAVFAGGIVPGGAWQLEFDYAFKGSGLLEFWINDWESIPGIEYTTLVVDSKDGKSPVLSTPLAPFAEDNAAFKWHFVSIRLDDEALFGGEVDPDAHYDRITFLNNSTELISFVVDELKILGCTPADEGGELPDGCTTEPFPVTKVWTIYDEELMPGFTTKWSFSAYVSEGFVGGPGTGGAPAFSGDVSIFAVLQPFGVLRFTGPRTFPGDSVVTMWINEGDSDNQIFGTEFVIEDDAGVSPYLVIPFATAVPNFQLGQWNEATLDLEAAGAAPTDTYDSIAVVNKQDFVISIQVDLLQVSTPITLHKVVCPDGTPPPLPACAQVTVSAPHPVGTVSNGTGQAAADGFASCAFGHSAAAGSWEQVSPEGINVTACLDPALTVDPWRPVAVPTAYEAMRCAEHAVDAAYVDSAPRPLVADYPDFCEGPLDYGGDCFPDAVDPLSVTSFAADPGASEWPIESVAFDDAVEGGWSDWSWAARVDPFRVGGLALGAAGAPAASPRALDVQLTPGGGLRLHSHAPVVAADGEGPLYVHFYLRAAPGAYLAGETYLFAGDFSGDGATGAPLDSFVATREGEWVLAIVPVSDLTASPAAVSDLVIYNANGAEGSAFSLDAVAVVRGPPVEVGACPSALGCALAPAAPTRPAAVVYADAALEPGWSDLSWNSQRDYAAPQAAATGSSGIAAEIFAFGALKVSNEGRSLDGGVLTFHVKLVRGDPAALVVQVESLVAGVPAAFFDLEPVVVQGQWAVASFELPSSGLYQSITIFNGGDAPVAVHLDDVRVEFARGDEGGGGGGGRPLSCLSFAGAPAVALADGVKARTAVYVPAPFQVAAVSVAVDAQHAEADDLELTVELLGSGHAVTLARPGLVAGGELRGTTFSSLGDTPLSGGGAPYTGVFRAAEDFGPLLGRSAKGTWRVTAVDRHANGLGGVLRHVNITLCSAAPSAA